MPTANNSTTNSADNDTVQVLPRVYRPSLPTTNYATANNSSSFDLLPRIQGPPLSSTNYKTTTTIYDPCPSLLSRKH